MIVKENEVLQLASDETYDAPPKVQVTAALPKLSPDMARPLWQTADYHALIGTYRQHPVYVLSFTHAPQLDGFAMMPLRRLLPRVDADLFALAGRACQVAYFIRTHNYCSHCGHALEEMEDELAVYCGSCDYRTYPRISPCIIVAVHRGRDEDAQILLAQGVRHPEGLYSLLAGFVESGESLEQTVVREVAEETGVRVTNLEYIKSQPWPFPHSLMMGFVAEYDGGDLIIDDHEIVTADWFSFRQLPRTPPAGTIAASLIEAARIRAKA